MDSNGEEKKKGLGSSLISWFKGKRGEPLESPVQPASSPGGVQPVSSPLERPDEEKSPMPPTASGIIQPAVPYLESLNKVNEPRRFSLERRTIRIGRAPDNDLVISETFFGWETVSRYHAEVRLEKDRWVLVDSGSPNGVFVNGRRTGRNFLRDGYSVQFLFRTGKNSRPDETPQTRGEGEA